MHGARECVGMDDGLQIRCQSVPTSNYPIIRKASRSINNGLIAHLYMWIAAALKALCHPAEISEGSGLVSHGDSHDPAAKSPAAAAGS